MSTETIEVTPMCGGIVMDRIVEIVADTHGVTIREDGGAKTLVMANRSAVRAVQLALRDEEIDSSDHRAYRDAENFKDVQMQIERET